MIHEWWKVHGTFLPCDQTFDSEEAAIEYAKNRFNDWAPLVSVVHSKVVWTGALGKEPQECTCDSMDYATAVGCPIHGKKEKEETDGAVSTPAGSGRPPEQREDPIR